LFYSNLTGIVALRPTYNIASQAIRGFGAGLIKNAIFKLY